MFPRPGFFAQEPAIASIELLEDSYLAEISFSDFVRLTEEFAVVQVLLEKIRSAPEKARATHAGIWRIYRRRSFAGSFASHKGLFNVAGQRDIASFLGIKDGGFHRYL